MPVFDRPVFIVAPPRSGTTLLFDLLAQSPALWTIGGESHHLIETIPSLHPRAHDWHSNCLEAPDAEPEVARRLTAAFAANLRDRGGNCPPAEIPVRFLEKTPRNCLRVRFLVTLFPDARFIYLHRAARETVASMLEAWRSRRFISYPELPGWTGPPWSLLLVPGWRDLAGRELAEIAARQWAAATARLLDDLDELPPSRSCSVDYHQLVADPQRELERLCAWIGVPWDRIVSAPPPPTKTALTPPMAEKWRINEKELERVMPVVEEVVRRAEGW